MALPPHINRIERIEAFLRCISLSSKKKHNTHNHLGCGVIGIGDSGAKFKVVYMRHRTPLLSE